MCEHCYDFIEDTVCIHTHDGPKKKLRKGIKYWLSLAEDDRRTDSLQKKIENSPKGHRAAVLRWLSQHILAQHFSQAVEHLEILIRESLQEKDLPVDEPLINKPSFIKIVHAFETINYARIREVLRTPRSLELLNLTKKPDLVPMICDKQLHPFSRQACNFSQVAKDNITENDLELLPQLRCQCRIFLPECTDLVDGHVMTANYNWINDPQLHRMFGYGLKFRLNTNEDQVLEAIKLGLESYVSERIARLPTQSPARIHLLDRLEEWKDYMLQQCRVNFTAH